MDKPTVEIMPDMDALIDRCKQLKDFKYETYANPKTGLYRITWWPDSEVKK